VSNLHYPAAARPVSSFDVPTPFVGQFYVQDNSTATVIAQTETFYKIAGTPVAGDFNSGFSVSQDRITYTGGKPTLCLIFTSVNFTAGNANEIRLAVFSSRTQSIVPASIVKATAGSTGRAESIALSCLLFLAPGDYFEIHAANWTATTNITVTDINVITTEAPQ
jgi:hypothetical protein